MRNFGQERAFRVRLFASNAVAPRANWKGFLKVSEVTCPVALYTAASTAERISFHILNRKTGHRVRRQFVDSETGRPVDRDEQVKGYEIGPDDYVILEPDEIASAVPDSDKTLSVSAFIGCEEIDDVYFDKPYYLAPADAHAEEAFALIRDGMRAKDVAALAQTVLFRRLRTVLVRPQGAGMIATTLNFDYEVRSAEDAFSGVADMSIKGEMLDLAKHIIKTKEGRFDPASFDDRYEAVLAELVKAKTEGRTIETRKLPRRDKVVDLMAALRESARIAKKDARTPVPRSRRSASSKTKAAPPRRKAG